MFNFTPSPNVRSNVTGNLPCLILLGAMATGVQISPTNVFAGTKTIVRSDYDKDDYILVASTIKNSSTQSDTEGPAVRQREPAFNLDLTGVEGTASTRVKIGRGVTLPNPNNYYAITGISVEEEWDKPCRLRLIGRLIDPRFQSDTRDLANLKIGKCRTSVPKTVNVAEDTPENFVYSDQGQAKHFISSISVCSGRQGLFLPQQAYNHVVWKIKGLKAQASVVSLVDSVALKGQVDIGSAKISSFTLTNCLDVMATTYTNPGWKSWHECPLGQIATGVTAYHREDDWFTGLALECQSVSARYVAAPPVSDAVGY